MDDSKVIRKVARHILETMQFNGNFNGTLYDFVANGDFRTALGDFKTDIRMILPQNNTKNYYQKPFYKGTLKTNNFALGRLIDEENIVQNISVDGKIPFV